ncbi:hypothetical protein AAHA92_00514 [Salvia divinorum]|uniref:Uncharacterized protein n=1 Tax=Salvia divinorum TaxID=28513 RepID=A0ABD1IKD8_SALDI
MKFLPALFLWTPLVAAEEVAARCAPPIGADDALIANVLITSAPFLFFPNKSGERSLHLHHPKPTQFTATALLCWMPFAISNFTFLQEEKLTQVKLEL